jgi:hypothetical protein
MPASAPPATAKTGCEAHKGAPKLARERRTSCGGRPTGRECGIGAEDLLEGVQRLTGELLMVFGPPKSIDSRNHKSHFRSPAWARQGGSTVQIAADERCAAG